MNSDGNKRRSLVICILLIIASTLTTFWPVLENDFINYDDPDYVTANEVVKKGLTMEGFKWVFTTGHASNWHPVTWLSHMADVSMFGLNPMGHHATNLVFHVVNSVLLLLLLWLMTGSVWRSSMVAALFALHPLHVESVAWVAERKDVLSAFFGILTLMAYSHYVGESKVKSPKSKVWYALVLVLFALGLMSKPMLVTWPFVMLLLDFWPLGRIAANGRWTMEDGKVWKRLILEKLPFLLLAAISSAITLAVQQGAMSKTEIVPIGDRFCNAVLACANYLQQTAWPAKLAVFYPFPTTFPATEFAIAAGFLIALFVLSIRSVRTHPFVIIGWLWFIGTLVPVIGIVQVGAQARADRYTYIPLIGIFILLVWGIRLLEGKTAKFRRLIQIGMVLSLAASVMVTRQQLKHWLNSETLFTHAIEHTEGNYIAWAGLGIIEFRRDNYELAIQHLERSLEMVTQGTIANQIRYYIGATKQKQGKGLEALPYLEQSPDVGILQPERNYRLGLSLIEAGRLEDAERSLKLACSAKADNTDFLLGKAALLHKQGRLLEAESLFQKILAKNPDSGLAQGLYGNFLTLISRPEQAEVHFSKAVILLPRDVTVRQNRAINLGRLGKTSEAVQEIQACVLIQPQNPELQANLAELLVQNGEIRQGIDAYEKLIQNSPDHLSAINNLAWLLATHPDAGHRNGKRAVDLGERACQLTNWKVPVLLGTLAAAYAESGRFEDAVAMSDKAKTLAVQQKLPEIAKRNIELMELYKNRQPFHESSK